MNEELKNRVAHLERALQGCARYAMRIKSQAPAFDQANARAIVELAEGTIPDGDLLSGSESIYGFVAWLSTQELTLALGAEHDAAVWPPLIEKFCQTNSLAEPREDWAEFLTHPASRP